MNSLDFLALRIVCTQEGFQSRPHSACNRQGLLFTLTAASVQSSIVAHLAWRCLSYFFILIPSSLLFEILAAQLLPSLHQLQLIFHNSFIPSTLIHNLTLSPPCTISFFPFTAHCPIYFHFIAFYFQLKSFKKNTLCSYFLYASGSKDVIW